jgi:hypothetical protein
LVNYGHSFPALLGFVPSVALIFIKVSEKKLNMEFCRLYGKFNSAFKEGGGAQNKLTNPEINFLFELFIY